MDGIFAQVCVCVCCNGRRCEVLGFLRFLSGRILWRQDGERVLGSFGQSVCWATDIGLDVVWMSAVRCIIGYFARNNYSE